MRQVNHAAVRPTPGFGTPFTCQEAHHCQPPEDKDSNGQHRKAGQGYESRQRYGTKPGRPVRVSGAIIFGLAVGVAANSLDPRHIVAPGHPLCRQADQEIQSAYKDDEGHSSTLKSNKLYSVTYSKANVYITYLT